MAPASDTSTTRYGSLDGFIEAADYTIGTDAPPRQRPSLNRVSIVFEAVRAGVPSSTILRMVFYPAVDTLVGSVRLIGSTFDSVWKANGWNARLFAEALEPQEDPVR